MLVDKAKITIVSGKGGNGSVSFRHNLILHPTKLPFAQTPPPEIQNTDITRKF